MANQLKEVIQGANRETVILIDPHHCKAVISKSEFTGTTCKLEEYIGDNTFLNSLKTPFSLLGDSELPYLVDIACHESIKPKLLRKRVELALSNLEDDHNLVKDKISQSVKYYIAGDSPSIALRKAKLRGKVDLVIHKQYLKRFLRQEKT